MTHMLIITSDNLAYSYGIGKHGELGLTDKIKTANQPYIIDLFKISEIKEDSILKVYACIRSSFILLESGLVIVFGSNRNNELGLISSLEDKENVKMFKKDFFEPILLKTMSKTPVRAIKSSFRHTIYITKDNQIYGCGNNSKGALALYSNLYESVVALTCLSNIWAVKSIKKVAVSWNNVLLLTSIL